MKDEDVQPRHATRRKLGCSAFPGDCEVHICARAHMGMAPLTEKEESAPEQEESHFQGAVCSGPWLLFAQGDMHCYTCAPYPQASPVRKPFVSEGRRRV